MATPQQRLVDLVNTWTDQELDDFIGSYPADRRLSTHMTTDAKRRAARNLASGRTDTGGTIPTCNHPSQLAAAIGAPVSQTWMESYATLRTLKNLLEAPAGTTIDENGCNHVVALASLLGTPTETDWDTLLQHARRLAVPTATATTATTDPMRGLKVPEEKDILPFPGREKWEIWDRAFTNFCEVYPSDMPSTLVHAFMARIKNRTQENPECAFLKPLPASNFARPAGSFQWTTSWQHFREAMYQHFRPYDYVEAHQMAWENATERMRKARHKHAADYYGDFARILATYEIAVMREPRLRTISEQEKVTKFYAALPIEVVNRLGTIVGDVWRDDDWQQRRTSVEKVWADVFRERPHAVKRSAAEAFEEEEEDDEFAGTLLLQKRIKTGAQCILRYMAVKIPEQFRGRLQSGENRELLKRLERAGRCTTCRRTRAEHKGPSPFDDASRYPRMGNVRFAEGEENEENNSAPDGTISSEENS